jgi:hypothetical protein
MKSNDAIARMMFEPEQFLIEDVGNGRLKLIVKESSNNDDQKLKDDLNHMYSEEND